ncbi:transmembrane protease serine 9 [Chrysoperla carnea]|uniref:transmembrane protease serine 9 n=1 Tax=Chrysoperla carnea TaxID=189513 RepID=UPI001D08ABBD|nr:transmembrane protease serine 9 [Chrysoperla carnea]
MATLKSSLVFIQLIVFYFTVISCIGIPRKPTNYSGIDSSEESTTTRPGVDVDVEERILHGTIAKPKSYPYMVSLQEKDEDGSAKFCGGVIIRPRWILTAAHCYEDIEGPENFPNDYRVKAGVIKAYANTPTAQFIRVKKIILHPRYDTNTAENDIALLFLDRSLKYNHYVRPIALPPKNYNAKGDGTIIGWGAIDHAEEISSKVLRFAPLKVSERRHCRKYFETITKNQLCLGYKAKENACAGDSGGPYVQKINGKPAVVGVTSFGTVGCHENDPIVYTNVASYLKFIKDTIDANTPKYLIKPKTISGRNAKTLKHPYLAAIMEFNDEDNIYEKTCTAVIIESQFVLTTADCFDNREKSEKDYLKTLRVKVGSLDVDSSDKGELYEVQNIRKHPNYYISDSSMKDNIAVLKLKKPLKLSENVAKALFPPSYFDLKSIQGEIIGWDINNLTQSHNLVISNVRNGNATACKQLYPDASDSEICVECTNNVCNQEAGSPLIFKTKNGNFVIGLNSIFSKNCENNQPFLVANILHYNKFIDDVFNDTIQRYYY